MKHKHHIIPRHVGGTNDPSNIIELELEDHAEAHRILYEEHGRWQDFCAWQGLLGIIPKADLIRQIQSIANKRETKGPMTEQERLNRCKGQIGKIGPNEMQRLDISIAAKRNHAAGIYDYKAMAEMRKGFHQPESQKIKVAVALADEYDFVSPTGEHIHVTNLHKFCRDNNLDQGNMLRVHQEKPRYNSCKGWRKHK